MTDKKLIEDAVTAFTDREITPPSLEHLRIALEAFEASLTRCGCEACTTARRERTGLSDHDRTSIARVLHEIVYSPGANYDRAVPGIQEHMLACAEKVAAALPWMTPPADALEAAEKAHTPKELWLPVIGFEGSYEVSDQGRVRSLGRIIRSGDSTRRVKGMVLERAADRGGHLRVHLRSSDARTQVYVHRLVLQSFVGPCPHGMEGCHNDGDPSNNWLSNLRWDTQSGNQRDRELHGTNHERNKTHCPMNHPLTAPNLVPWSERQGWRLCLACRRARAHARRAGIPFTQELADQKFAKITKAGQS